MHTKKSLGKMKTERTVKRVTFDKTEANPSETLYISVRKLNKVEVMVPSSLALLFTLVVSGHASSYFVQNVSWMLVDKLVVKYMGTTLQETVGYDIYKIFEDLFLSSDEHENLLLELNVVYRKHYHIRLDHQILADLGVFYPQALYNDLVSEITLAPATQVIKRQQCEQVEQQAGLPRLPRVAWGRSSNTMWQAVI